MKDLFKIFVFLPTLSLVSQGLAMEEEETQRRYQSLTPQSRHAIDFA